MRYRKASKRLPTLCCRLLEAAAWAASRWAGTYLMPEEAVSRVMHDAFGAGAGGADTVELLVKVAGAVCGHFSMLRKF